MFPVVPPAGSAPSYIGGHEVGGHICDHQASNDAPARQIGQAQEHLDQREQDPCNVSAGF